MKRLFSPLYRFFMNTSITRKLFIGYLIIVLIPTLSMDYVLYKANYNSMLQSHLANEQSALNATAQNLATRLNQTMSLTKPLEGSTSLYGYLAGSYTVLADSLYDYIKDIRPLFSNFSTKNALSDFTVYTFRNYVLTISQYFSPFEELPDGDFLLDEISHNVNGIWRFEPDGSNNTHLVYYKAIFNTNYTSVIGIIRMETDSKLFFDNFFPELSEGRLYYMEETQTGRLYQYSNGTITPAELSDTESGNKNIYLQTAALDNFPLRFVHQLDIRQALHFDITYILLLLFTVLCLLTILYIFVARSITARILSLTKHIRLSDAGALQHYNSERYHDEIGILTDTFNEMIDRINHLIHENYQAELSRKDAEYYALQAQIQPHFLFNILENIRMNAEISHAPQTADMLLSLGKFMRYNLNTSMAAVSLSDELDSARNYLSILEIRMEEQFIYEIAAFTEIDDVFCPRFVLQPLLENSVKHGGKKEKTLHLSIQIKDVEEDENSVLIVIEDDGIGIGAAQRERLNLDLANNVMDGDSHVGLCNVNNRLIAFNGIKGQLKIDASSTMGCRISFQLSRKGRTK